MPLISSQPSVARDAAALQAVGLVYRNERWASAPRKAEPGRCAMGTECNGAGQAFRLGRGESAFDEPDFEDPGFEAEGILLLVFPRAEG
jgi:hypothetical protein